MRKVPKGRPFVKGQSGNPSGRPKKEVSITALIKAALEKTRLCGKPVPGELTAAEALAESMIWLAIQGSAPHMREIIARVDGVLNPNAQHDEDAASFLRAALDESDRRAKQLYRDRELGIDRWQIQHLEDELGPDWRDRLGVVDKPSETVIDVESKALPGPAKPKKKARKA